MPRRLILACLALPALLLACASRPPQPPEPLLLGLLPPAEIAAEVLLKQKLTFVAAGREQQFLGVARLERERVVLVLLLPGGQALLTLDYDGRRLEQENRSPVDLPGREILASLQFALWPEDSLRRYYTAESGWQLVLGEAQRSLLTASGTVLKIARDADNLVVDNRLHDYRVIIQTLEKAEL